MPTVKELEKLLGEVKKGGVADFSGGSRKVKSGVTKGRIQKTTPGHPLAGILSHAARKSYYGGMDDHAGLKGGAAILPLVAPALASLVIGDAVGQFKRIMGMGSDKCCGGGLKEDFFKELEKVLKSAFMEVFKKAGSGVHKELEGGFLPFLMARAIPSNLPGKIGDLLGLGGVEDFSGGADCDTEGGFIQKIIYDIIKEDIKGKVKNVKQGARMGREYIRKLTGFGGVEDFSGGVEDFSGGVLGFDGKKARKVPKTSKTKSNVKISTGSGKRKTNPWLTHVQKVRKENPGVAYKDILKMAKKTY